MSLFIIGKKLHLYKIPSKVLIITMWWALKVIYIIANKNVLSNTPGPLNTGDNYTGRMIFHCQLHFQDTFICPAHSPEQPNTH